MSRTVFSGQGFAIFWGSLSVFFAVAAAYYFWQNQQHERTARILSDQEAQLRSEITDLKGQVTRLQEDAKRTDEEKAEASQDHKVQQQQEALIKAAETAEARAREARDKAEEELEKTQTALEETLSKLEEIKEASEAPDPEYGEIREKLKTLTQLPDVQLVDRNGIPVIRILNDKLLDTRVTKEKPPRLLFTLKPSARAALERFASVVRPLLDTREIRVESYSDGDPIPDRLDDTVPSNYELSAKRASVVSRFLKEELNLPVEKVVVVGRAEAYPVAPNDTDENKALNRRLELVLARSTWVAPETDEQPAPPAESATSGGAPTVAPLPTPKPVPTEVGTKPETAEVEAKPNGE